MKDLYSLKRDAKTNLIQLSGELSFSTVNSILEQAEIEFDPIIALDIDLIGIKRSDSAGLALLVHWIRLAKKTNKNIVFHNVPAQMLAIAEASGLADLLPIQ